MTLGETELRGLEERYGSGAKGGRLFSAGMGAEAVRDIISRMDLEELSRSLHVEVRTSSGQRRKKAIKRLRLIEAFRRSGTRPDWMILSVLPVIPPDLRPMVQLDGGRFATSDLNDLYRRVINRNNRLKRLLELGAPEIIIRNEKRMLQEACDALIDNGRRGRAIAGTGNHRLKSLSDMLKGKQGRFRQNLLGKRVDYSGRSVIVVGPELKLHQCGLPKKMALELFKPFVMRQLVEKGFAHNIKSAKRIVERVRPEVWDVLEEVIKDHPVLLNRAPTLHRLGIQAFMPVLVEGSAIQIHPLVCTAFNADFDGDQMAVHVPLSSAAQEEARTMMLSTANLLSPADGSPVIAPTQDMVLGCYYLTMDPIGKQPKRVRLFATEDEAILSYQLKEKTGVTLHEPIEAEVQTWVDRRRAALAPARVRTTVGRILFNQILPDQLRYSDKVMVRTELKELIDECYRMLGPDETAHLADGIKSVGFDFATRGGMTIGVFDIEVPKDKAARLKGADDNVAQIDRQFQRGLITEDERYEQVVDVWQKTTSAMSDEMMKGAQGRRPGDDDDRLRCPRKQGQHRPARRDARPDGRPVGPDHRRPRPEQLPRGHDGPRVLHLDPRRPQGPRRHRPPDGRLRLSDPAPRRRRPGRHHPRRRLRHRGGQLDHPRGLQRREGIPSPAHRPARGRPVARPDRQGQEGRDGAAHRRPQRGDQQGDRGHASTRPGSTRSSSAHRSPARPATASAGRATAATSPPARWSPPARPSGSSPPSRSASRAPSSTMRTFHTGGVAGLDITAGLPRVEELFEARVPKGKAEISHIDGIVEIIRSDTGTKVKVTSTEVYDTSLALPKGAEMLAAAGDLVEANQVVARIGDGKDKDRQGRRTDVIAPVQGFLVKGDDGLVVRAEDVVEREYTIPHNAKILVENGQEIRAGDAITDGPINPQEYLDTRGKDAVQRYLVKEVQKVYRSQGVTINDKHIEIIVRQMLRKVRIDQPGDVDLLPTELIDRLDFEEANNRVLSEGGEPATAQTVLLGVTKASLNTSSLPRRRLVPGDDPGADRGRHQRRQGPPDRPQGERHHRQAHPGRDGCAGERRGPQGARAAGGHRGPCRRGDRGRRQPSTTRSSRRAASARPTRPPGSPWRPRSPAARRRRRSEFNPFLVDDEAADSERRRGREPTAEPSPSPKRRAPRPSHRRILDRVAIDDLGGGCRSRSPVGPDSFDTIFGPLIHSAFVASAGAAVGVRADYPSSTTHPSRVPSRA